MTWIPHPGPQEEFMARGEWEVLFGGSAGPGKTDCLLWDAAADIHHPRYRALILRRTFPQLREIIDRCFEYFIQMGGVYRATEHRWHFPSGAKIALGHMQHVNDKHNYQGRQFHFVGFDELTQFEEEQYLYLFSRVRRADPDIPCRIRATSNPGGIGHRWVKERFIDTGKPGTAFIDARTGLSRAFIPAKVTDNPTIVENDPDYVARLEALPWVERRRLLDGDWSIFEGQAFPELGAAHRCEPFDIPAEWERICVLDWGFSKPFSVGWYAFDYDGRMYRYREYYGCKDHEADQGLQMTAVDVANGILDREQHGEHIKIRLADPSIWNKIPLTRRNEVVGPSVWEDMVSQGLHFTKADNDRLNGKQQMHKRLQIRENVNQETGEVVSDDAMFFAFSDQKHFWRTMETLQLSEKNPEDVWTDQEDHIYDEFRYACMLRPIRPKKVERIPQGSFQAERRKLMRAKRIARIKGVSLEQAYRGL